MRNKQTELVQDHRVESVFETSWTPKVSFTNCTKANEKAAKGPLAGIHVVQVGLLFFLLGFSTCDGAASAAKDLLQVVCTPGT